MNKAFPTGGGLQKTPNVSTDNPPQTATEQSFV